jgi:hypothetical protein
MFVAARSPRERSAFKLARAPVSERKVSRDRHAMRGGQHGCADLPLP